MRLQPLGWPAIESATENQHQGEFGRVDWESERGGATYHLALLDHVCIRPPWPVRVHWIEERRAWARLLLH